MKLIEASRKSRILTKAQFGCLSNANTINVTKGCEFTCVYCYARGYPEAPLTGEVHLYENLPDKLAQELDNPRRRTAIDSVVINTASDSFQTHPKILDITYRSMRVLLERGIAFSFLTKGWIPDRFLELFSHHPDLVTARIGLVSLSPRYRDLFEPHSATAAERLDNIDRLKGTDIDVEVRIDPIIPFYTDDEDSIARLIKALAERSIGRVSLSYLHLRPAILNQIRQELPPTEFSVIQTCFESQPWSVVGTSSRSKLIPLALRRKGYERFIKISEGSGITPFICSCKNPDMPAQLCTTGINMRKPRNVQREEEKQLSLFPC
jgi:DNA repair photolyase